MAPPVANHAPQSAPRAVQTFEAFYAAYLRAHRHPVNRALHLVAKLSMVALFAAAVHARQPLLLLAVPIAGVAPCWIGHFLFEGNRPSLWGDSSASLLGSLSRIARRASGPHAGRFYYSFLADVRMCAAMFGIGDRAAKLQGGASDRT